MQACVNATCHTTTLADTPITNHTSTPHPFHPPADAAVVINSLLHHPAASTRQEAGDWLRRFAALSPLAHHWAFSSVVLPLLLGPISSISNGSTPEAPAGAAQQAGGSNEEQVALSREFIQSLDESEVRGRIKFVKFVVKFVYKSV